MRPPSPAMDILMEALAGTGLHPVIHETTNPGTVAPWTASLPPVVVHLDGTAPAQLPVHDRDHGIQELAGAGLTRDDALADLLRQVRRVTYALHVGGMDLARGSYAWTALAWDGSRLVITESGVSSLQVQEVRAA